MVKVWFIQFVTFIKFWKDTVSLSLSANRIIEKFDSAVSVVDIKHMTRACGGHSETNITAVCENVFECPEASFLHHHHHHIR